MSLANYAYPEPQQWAWEGTIPGVTMINIAEFDDVNDAGWR
jgi:hypothetical protein